MKKILIFNISLFFSFVISSTAEAADKTTTDIVNFIVPPTLFAASTPLTQILNQLFYIGLIAAVILAVSMIVRGGIEYMSIDSATGKEGGKNKFKAAIGGLLLAFSAILILKTINPGLVRMDLVLSPLNKISSILFNPLTSEKRNIPVYNWAGGLWNEQDTESWLMRQENGERKTDGTLNISTYSKTGDSVTDSNTAGGRGNADNLLREGSVALSPDLIKKYQPQTGQEVFINGISVGYYEDTTASTYKGTEIKNTIDVYDENNTLGEQLKNVSNWTITFGNARPQVSNPSN